MNAKLIRIDISKTTYGEKVLWHAQSPDLPNFRLTDGSRSEVLAQVSGALELRFEGWRAFQVEWTRDDNLYWTVVPLAPESKPA